MKFWKNKIIKNKETLIYIVITIAFFGIFSSIEYALDTYATFSFSIQDLYNQFVSCGRFFIVLVGFLLKLFNINDELCYFLSFILAILCMIISQYKLYNIIKKDIKCEKLRIIVPTLIVLNIFSIELFLFIEKGIMVFSILMCICGVEAIIKVFDKKEKKYIIFALAYMLFANFSYQGVTGIFIAISLIYIIKYSKNKKEFVFNNIIVALVYGIPSLIDYILIRVLSVGSRVSGDIVLFESIKKIIKSTINMVITTYDLLPKYLYIVLFSIIIIILIWQISLQKERKLSQIFKIAYISAGVIAATIFPQIMQNTDSIWFVPRSTYPYATLYGILVLYLLMNYDLNDFLQKIVIVLSIILLIFQFYSFNKILTDRYKVNAIDYEITKMICEYIDKYEKTTGNEIKKIAIYKDQSPEYSYNGIFISGDINLKAYAKEWSVLYIINYYYNRMLTPAEIDSQKQEEFNKRNWTSFSNEQLIFEEDTLHFCMY